MEELVVLIGLALLSVPVLLVVGLIMLFGLRRRVADLEDVSERLRAEIAARAMPAASAPSAFRATPAAASASVSPTSPVQPPAPDHVRPASPAPVAAPPPLPPALPRAQWRDADPVRPAPSASAHRPPEAPTGPGVVERGLRLVRQWFTSGNVPVKIGMLVLFAGVAALLKYASDQGLLQVPVSIRLAAVSAAAVAGLVFGWLRRDSHRTFALSLQGGMIGILLLVVFAASKLFGLVEPGFAFAASVLLVFGAGALAVLQGAMALAVFAVLAGFLAPIWLSTGSGNHVALFGYYAVLNTAIVAIAWFRAWRLLNLLGFVFTFGIGTLWGVLDYQAADYRSAQAFLALFFAIYLAVPLLHARRRPMGRRDLIDGCLVFGTPLIAFSLQAGLMRDDTTTLALCALGLAAVYAGLSWWLRRGGRFEVLQQGYALLAAGFATLAVPLALSAQATASVFALEGAALVWLGLRQQRRLPRWSGIALQGAAVVAYVFAAGNTTVSDTPFAHGLFVGAMLFVVAGLAIAWAYARAGATLPARLAYLWAMLWWLAAWTFELQRVLPARDFPDALLVLAAVTGWLAAERSRRVFDPLLAGTACLALAAALPLAYLQAVAHQQPFAGNGLWAWLVFAALGVRSLLCLRVGEGGFARAAQFVWWLLWPFAVSLLLVQLSERMDGGDGWSLVAAVTPWLAITSVALLRWSWLTHPLGATFDPMRAAFRTVCCALLALWWLLALGSAGNAAPLPWIALINPLDLAQVAVLLLIARWLWRGDSPFDGRARVPMLSAGAFLLVTVITLRGAHHWGGVPWSSALVGSSLAQTSLTVVWSVLGVLGWVIGSRRGQRMLWLAGAALMAIVLAKLVLVDRSHLGNLWGIGSFIAYGLLCTVVGFFAPAPPRAPASETAQEAIV
ncbi:conserved membrane hypothetical protein [Luteimonas sp. 9C]|uniref:DUF2339 domain-containing protein n=1 Tax=Luteimonas sp. 9C TaxID=2653148 RepID=UPI0012EEF8F4|nr:DUF2339 domain-containing protein [Luteimonas sp. 9C]VXB00788.1 conserved membrane hypothetical protein [Luteimonas sp. 9C]